MRQPLELEWTSQSHSHGRRNPPGRGAGPPLAACAGSAARVRFAATGDPSDAWDGATDDTLALLNAALDVTPQADPNRIGMWGHSMGGEVTLRALLVSDRIRAAAIWSSVLPRKA